ncbi:VCBS repeat-containing protein [Aureimonas altamirensis DSM 21988]|uniref:VCBS repeat-containing protein n=1 Tax=Aureimonas altamirensis DSM 21988 TaxID=1121026 RepID=A0ABY1ICY4_9HYPH|nr:Ig-like domain-containing protein [Aureimonas altamirensis]SHI98862.1 VCBS repeat-containing protein [Aureimonas altamirensis DSM 21988]
MADGTQGDVRITVSQSALIAVADAFYVEVLDAQGNSVYVATASNDPLIGDAAGLRVLGATGDNSLVATIPGLAPGDYTIVVRKGESALGTLLDADGNGVSLSELGQGGVVLGADNQALVLNAVETTLNGELLPGIGLPLGTVVRNILEPILGVTTDIGAGDLVGIVSNALNSLGLSQFVDGVLGALSQALLSNTLSLIQDTSVTVDVVEHGFSTPPAPASGNVIDPDGDVDGEPGEDIVTEGTVVSQVTFGTGEPVLVGPEGAVIEGAHGSLEIFPDGSYTYTPNGQISSVGQSDVFTYTITDGTLTSEASLTINIDGARLTDDTVEAGIEYEYVTEPGIAIPNAVNYSWTGVIAGVPAFPSGNLTSAPITVAAGTTQDLTLNVSVGALASLGSGVTVFVEVLQNGTWTQYGQFGGGQLLSLLGSGGTGEISVLDVPAGTYRVRGELSFSLVSVAGNVTIGVESTITNLNDFEQGDVFGVSGNLYENDLLAGVEPSGLAISADGAAFQTIPTGASLSIAGEFGSLLVNADGTYTYTPDGRAEIGSSVDTFVYQANVDGVIHTATLTVNVSGSVQGAAPPVATLDLQMVDDDVVPLGAFAEEGDADADVDGDTDVGQLDDDIALDLGEDSEIALFADDAFDADAEADAGAGPSAEGSLALNDMLPAEQAEAFLTTDPLTEDERTTGIA